VIAALLAALSLAIPHWMVIQVDLSHN